MAYALHAFGVMARTSIRLNESQKEALVRFKAQVERETGEEITQGMAVAIAAQKGAEIMEPTDG